MLTFSRVPTRQIEELMSDSELVVGVLEDMGFNIEDELDNDTMLSLMESRWQGMEQSYSLESFAPIAHQILLDSCAPAALNLLLKGGKASEVEWKGTTVHVLSPAEVTAIALALTNIDLLTLRQAWAESEKWERALPNTSEEEKELFWMLFPGLIAFFNLAAEARDCVLRAGQ